MERLPQARNAHNEQNVRRRIRQGSQHVGRGKRCVRKGRQKFGNVTGRVHKRRKCVAKLKNRKVAGPGQIPNEILRYGREGMLTMMAMLYI